MNRVHSSVSSRRRRFSVSASVPAARLMQLSADPRVAEITAAFQAVADGDSRSDVLGSSQ
jgi:hypothetical protein